MEPSCDDLLEEFTKSDEESLESDEEFTKSDSYQESLDVAVSVEMETMCKGDIVSEESAITAVIEATHMEAMSPGVSSFSEAEAQTTIQYTKLDVDNTLSHHLQVSPFVMEPSHRNSLGLSGLDIFVGDKIVTVNSDESRDSQELRINGKDLKDGHALIINYLTKEDLAKD
ncbi:unnamed protein product [Cochlearia groenlandica]